MSMYKPDIRIVSNKPISKKDLSELNDKIAELLTEFSQEQCGNGVSTDISLSWYEKKEIF